MTLNWHVEMPAGWRGDDHPKEEETIVALMERIREALFAAARFLPPGTAIRLVDEDAAPREGVLVILIGE